MTDESDKPNFIIELAQFIGGLVTIYCLSLVAYLVIKHLTKLVFNLELP